jgi:hypothetical protein
MNAEFNVWMLIVGLVLGAGLVWVVIMDGRRQEADVDAIELPREAAWASAIMAEEGYDVSPAAAEQLLLLHRAYLGAPPPDPVEPAVFDDDPAPSEPPAPDLLAGGEIEPVAAGEIEPVAAGEIERETT